EGQMLLNTINLTSISNPRVATADFERAFEKAGSSAIEDFLPATSDPQYPSILAQLLRLDMRLHWAVGCRKSLDDYRHLYPAALADPERLAAVAHEEYKARVAAGDRVEPRDYEARYGVNVDDWPEPEQKELVSLPLGDTCCISQPGKSVEQPEP